MSIDITFLGTGTSHGVPSIDCMLAKHAHCRKGVCAASETDPKHRRTRCSVYLSYNGRGVLLDSSLDFREQALRERVPRIDALLVTHRHMDHLGGLPDIRSYTATPLAMYASAETLDEARRAYGYAFDPDAYVGGGIPRLEPHAVDSTFDLFGLAVTPVSVEHGILSGCLGYRIGPLAYIPDMKRIANAEKEKLRGLELLILNCLRDTRPHGTHMILPESIELARELAPHRCLFVHMCHDIHYELDSASLEPWMAFAWDGMRLKVG